MQNKPMLIHKPLVTCPWSIVTSQTHTHSHFHFHSVCLAVVTPSTLVSLALFNLFLFKMVCSYSFVGINQVGANFSALGGGGGQLVCTSSFLDKRLSLLSSF